MANGIFARRRGRGWLGRVADLRARPHAVGGGGMGEWATVAQARNVGGERRAGGCTSGDDRGCASGSGPRGMGAAHRVGVGQECPRVLVGWTHGLLVCYILT
jgi:hypothetical protein